MRYELIIIIISMPNLLLLKQRNLAGEYTKVVTSMHDRKSTVLV